MRRGHSRIGFDVVVGVAEEVRNVESEPHIDHEEAHKRQGILYREIRMEGQCVLVGLLLNACRIVRTRNMQRPDMEHNNARNHEGQEIVKREEAVQCRIGNRITTPQEGDDRIAHNRDRREEIGDHGRAPEAHLAPRQNVTHEGGCHHQQEDDHAEDPENFTRRFI